MSIYLQLSAWFANLLCCYDTQLLFLSAHSRLGGGGGIRSCFACMLFFFFCSQVSTDPSQLPPLRWQHQQLPTSDTAATSKPAALVAMHLPVLNSLHNHHPPPPPPPPVHLRHLCAADVIIVEWFVVLSAGQTLQPCTLVVSCILCFLVSSLLFLPQGGLQHRGH